MLLMTHLNQMKRYLSSLCIQLCIIYHPYADFTIPGILALTYHLYSSIFMLLLTNGIISSTVFIIYLASNSHTFTWPAILHTTFTLPAILYTFTYLRFYIYTTFTSPAILHTFTLPAILLSSPSLTINHLHNFNFMYQPISKAIPIQRS